VLIVGGDEVSYGARPDPSVYGNRTWKQILIDEVRPQIPDPDWSRVHFLGKLPYPKFVALLQLSRVHVYLTYPFVLSWSLLEAMSLGCAIVASDTAPLHEAIRHDDTGRLVDFFDPAAVTEAICDLLDDAASRARLGHNARAFAQATYDLKRVCLPQQLAGVEGLGDSGSISPR
jgi:glycosyltransferase involved in cell wall biosynthesis